MAYDRIHFMYNGVLMRGLPTPCELTQKRKYGPTGAHVWAVIWEDIKAHDGISFSSTTHLSERAGINRQTFIKYRDRLIEDGYFEVVNPNRQGQTSLTLVSTGKIDFPLYRDEKGRLVLE